MFLFQGLFHPTSEKKGDMSNLTIVNDSDTSSEDNTDNEEKSTSVQLVEPVETAVEPTEAPLKGHAANCTCINCNEILSRYAECHICLEPLQCYGPCMCPQCGGVWCTRCTKRITKCAWCRATLRSPAPPCPALQRLLNDLRLPCRNYKRGCTELLVASKRFSHEINCHLDPIVCPIGGPHCCTSEFEELQNHLQSSHNIIAVYSQKIKILIENFQTKLKKTACCRTKYKILLLSDKSAFIIKVSIHNYHVRVEVMRQRLGYAAIMNLEPEKKGYFAVIEFQSKDLQTQSHVVVENETYSKKAEVQCNDFTLAGDESLTIHITIDKSGIDSSRKPYHIVRSG